MPKPRKLPNYLRMYRRRLGLTQRHVAYLVQASSASKVSRYERARRLPGLRTLFAYEHALHVPAQELFEGIYDEIGAQTDRRSTRLQQKFNAQREAKATRHRHSPS